MFALVDYLVGPIHVPIIFSLLLVHSTLTHWLSVVIELYYVPIATYSLLRNHGNSLLVNSLIVFVVYT